MVPIYDQEQADLTSLLIYFAAMEVPLRITWADVVHPTDELPMSSSIATTSVDAMDLASLGSTSNTSWAHSIIVNQVDTGGSGSGHITMADAPPPPSRARRSTWNHSSLRESLRSNDQACTFLFHRTGDSGSTSDDPEASRCFGLLQEMAPMLDDKSFIEIASLFKLFPDQTQKWLFCLGSMMISGLPKPIRMEWCQYAETIHFRTGGVVSI